MKVQSEYTCFVYLLVNYSTFLFLFTHVCYSRPLIYSPQYSAIYCVVGIVFHNQPSWLHYAYHIICLTHTASRQIRHHSSTGSNLWRSHRVMPNLSGSCVCKANNVISTVQSRWLIVKYDTHYTVDSRVLRTIDQRSWVAYMCKQKWGKYCSWLGDTQSRYILIGTFIPRG